MIRLAGGLAIALVFAQACSELPADQLRVAQSPDEEGPVEEADDEVADWILRLFQSIEEGRDSGRQVPGSEHGDRDHSGSGYGGGGNNGGGSSGGGGDDDDGGGGGDDDGGDD